ncbi:M23 family metallopeptidase [Streptomyces sp. NPDC048639]|uniref:M23 family metallopeptidase n=1 Tax=Streptomyces sp. NPDC048639 TaxID=3365581 RepID=UPI003722BFEF
MASFTRATGKHRYRRPSRLARSGASLAGIATLATTGIVTSLAAGPASAAAPGHAPDAEQTGLRQAIVMDDSLARTVDAQAEAQQDAADAAAARAKAEAAAKKRAAEVKAEKKRAAREAERKRLNAFVLPVEGSYVSTSYGSAGGAWSSGSHTGVDFHASSGTTVRSVGAGTVVEAGWGGSYGNNIVIKMKDGTYTQYGHLSAVHVSVGRTVTPGEKIGLSGSTGNTTGPHLHFEARTSPDYGSDIDPVAYLRSHGLSL